MQTTEAKAAPSAGGVWARAREAVNAALCVAFLAGLAVCLGGMVLARRLLEGESDG